VEGGRDDTVDRRAVGGDDPRAARRDEPFGEAQADRRGFEQRRPAARNGISERIGRTDVDDQRPVGRCDPIIGGLGPQGGQSAARREEKEGFTD